MSFPSVFLRPSGSAQALCWAALIILLGTIFASFSSELHGQRNPESAKIFGKQFKNLETMAVGEWWKTKPDKRRSLKLDVERDRVCAFAVYTHDHGVLKLSLIHI